MSNVFRSYEQFVLQEPFEKHQKNNLILTVYKHGEYVEQSADSNQIPDDIIRLEQFKIL